MIPVMQTILSPPFGDCFRACVASILELTIDEVPNFNTYLAWYDALQWFLGDYGLYALDLRLISGASAKDFLRGYYIVSGKSPRFDCLHAVVGRDGNIVHDPFPGGGGIRSVDTFTVFCKEFM